MMTLRHITAAEVRHQQRHTERERERLNVIEKEKERKPNRQREREREIGIFSMMGFDTATSFSSLVSKTNHKEKN